MASFFQRFRDLSERHSPLCVGADPSSDILRRWELSDNIDGLRRFCERLLDALDGAVAVVKPQSAFFERFGANGIHELERFVRHVRQAGMLCLLDAKRGDIGSTVDAYAQAYLAHGSSLETDAITAVAYLGTDALRPLFDVAARDNKAVFVVVRSSNPEGQLLQKALIGDVSVWQHVVSDLTTFNSSAGTPVAGAVVGATLGSDIADILSVLPNELILAPGIGSQGASFEDMKRYFVGAKHRILASISRGILMNGPGVDSLRESIARYKESAFNALG